MARYEVLAEDDPSARLGRTRRLDELRTLVAASAGGAVAIERRAGRTRLLLAESRFIDPEAKRRWIGQARLAGADRKRARFFALLALLVAGASYLASAFALIGFECEFGAVGADKDPFPLAPFAACTDPNGGQVFYTADPLVALAFALLGGAALLYLWSLRLATRSPSLVVVGR